MYRIRKVDSGFNALTETYCIDFNLAIRTIDTISILQLKINCFNTVKGVTHSNLTCDIYVIFKKVTKGVYTVSVVCLSTKAFDLYQGSNIYKILNSGYKQLVSKIDTYETNGSWWILDCLVKLDCSIYHLDLQVSSYH